MVSKLGDGSPRSSGISKLGEVNQHQSGWYERRDGSDGIVKSRQHDYAAAQRKDREAAEAADNFEALVRQQQAQAEALMKADQARADARLKVDQARLDARARIDGVRSVTLTRGEIDPRGYQVASQTATPVKNTSGQGLLGAFRSKVEQATTAIKTYAGGGESIVRAPGPSSVPAPVEATKSPPPPPAPPRAELPDRRPDYDRPIAKREADYDRR